MSSGRLTTVRGTMVDISLRGARVHTLTLMPVGSLAQVILDGHRAPPIFVRVARTVDLNGRGYFLGMAVIEGQLPYEIFSALAFSGKSREDLATPDCIRSLGLELPCSIEDVKRAFREKAKTLHPDHGGDIRDFVKLRTAYSDALVYLGGNR